MRVEGNGVGEEDTDWERAHWIEWVWCEGGRHRLGEGALYRLRGVWEGDTDWERAHLRVEGNEWRREIPIGKERN